MKHDPIRALHTLRRIVPDASKKAEFRAALIARIREDRARPLIPRAWRFPFFSYFRLAPSAAFFAAILLLAGTGGASLAAQNALPGEILYPVKLATEKARLAAVQDEIKKTALRLIFASRRLEEAGKLMEKNGDEKENASIALDEYEKIISENETALQKDREKTVGIAAEIQSTAETHQRVIEKLSEKIEKKGSAKKLKEHLEKTRGKTEEKEDSALMVLISAPAEEASRHSEKAEKKTREKVEKREKKIRETALSVEKAKREGQDVKSADEKMRRAQTIIDRAKEKLNKKEIRASLEESIEAQKIAQEVAQEAERAEKEKKNEEKRERRASEKEEKE